jgi:hypothetical protein
LQETTTIGIDCSTNPKKLGISRGLFRNGRLIVLESRVDEGDPVALISNWINAEERCLLAIDAPLGWPGPMGVMLADHQAGMPLREEANTFFRRYTDVFIKEMINKQALDVGSNLIARTAHFALNLLQAIRERTGKVIPLAWQGEYETSCAAIEVYPAATLESRGLSSRGYKKPQEVARRRELLEALSDEMVIEAELDELVATDDTFDAALCLLAASDFLNGSCYAPRENMLTQVKKESWMWVKKAE